MGEEMIAVIKYSQSCDLCPIPKEAGNFSRNRISVNSTERRSIFKHEL